MWTRATSTFLFLFCLGLGDAAYPAPPPQEGTADSSPATGYDARTAIQISQAALDNTLGEHILKDANGQNISLSSFRGKPLVLSLVYTSCYHTCPLTTRHLAKVVEKARDALGKDRFDVAILGFDAPNDTPDAMRQFATKQGIMGKDWHLLSADQPTIEALAKELGFIYFPSPRGFDHIVQATVIDAQGSIYRQVYGETFDTPLLVEPLKDLIFNRRTPGEPFLDELIDRIRFFCTTYDPARDGYSFDISLFIGMFIGGSIILSGFSFIIWETIKRRRRQQS